MTYVIGTNETIVPKYLLCDLHELKVEKGKFIQICVAGIVSQLCKSGTKGVPGGAMGLGADNHKKSPLLNSTWGIKK